MFITYLMIIGFTISIVAFIHAWCIHRCRGYMLLPNPIILVIQITSIVFLLELIIVILLSVKTGNIMVLEESFTDVFLLSLIISPFICVYILKMLIKKYGENIHIISDNINDGVIAINENGIINYVNSAAMNLFDYSRDELVGKSVNILMPMQYSINHDQHIDKYLETGMNKVIGTGRKTIGKRRDGSMFPIYLSISEIRSDDRHIFVGVIQDMTEKEGSVKQNSRIDTVIQ